jgi:uncharacterized repeat protein (TIGR03803 family)
MSKRKNCPIKHSLAVAMIFLLSVVAAAQWKEQVLYSFQGGSTGLSHAIGRIVLDGASNLYGATQVGPGQGSVYQLARPAKLGDAWTETILYTFQGKPLNDGQVPSGGLLVDKRGNLYGVTGYGGAGGCILLGILSGCGAVYELSPPAQKGGAWTETILYSFQGGTDGDLPFGDLTWDENGNLYGATQYGGGYGTCNTYYGFCGTIFKLTAPQAQGGAWSEHVLYSFKGGNDGANPNGGLVFDAKGNMYGTTSWGGSTTVCVYTGFVGCGTVFRLNPSSSGTWTEDVLHRFQGRPSDGSGPNGNLILRAGALFGTTIGGGGNEDGVIFELAPTGKNVNSWKEIFIHVFDDGAPLTGLFEDSEGALYGTDSGGQSHGGAVFRLNPPSQGSGKWRLGVIHGFTGSPDGFDPQELMLCGDGTIYGTTEYGGTCTTLQGGCGTVFRIEP